MLELEELPKCVFVRIEGPDDAHVDGKSVLQSVRPVLVGYPAVAIDI